VSSNRLCLNQVKVRHKEYATDSVSHPGVVTKIPVGFLLNDDFLLASIQLPDDTTPDDVPPARIAKPILSESVWVFHAYAYAAQCRPKVVVNEKINMHLKFRQMELGQGTAGWDVFADAQKHYTSQVKPKFQCKCVQPVH
jgi:hypothetical protein